jgi:hypothetical protein
LFGILPLGCPVEEREEMSQVREIFRIQRCLLITHGKILVGWKIEDGDGRCRRSILLEIIGKSCKIPIRVSPLRSNLMQVNKRIRNLKSRRSWITIDMWRRL